jgi:hypothetical protein
MRKMNSIEELTDEAVYQAMQKGVPTLIEDVALLLESGLSPADIERKLQRRYGNIQMVRYVRHVANHIANTPA